MQSAISRADDIGSGALTTELDARRLDWTDYARDKPDAPRGMFVPAVPPTNVMAVRSTNPSRFPRGLRLLGLLGLGLVVAWTAQAAWVSFQRGQMLRAQYAPPPEGMVFVPPGEFWMGSDDPKSPPDERPLRRVFVPAYYIDRTEVTNAEFQRFQPEHAFPEGAENLPVTHVFKPEAEAYARWAGKRLPTNAEWEKAARGTDARLYPWGNEFDTNRCNMRPRSFALEPVPQVCLVTNNATRGKLPVGSFPLGASPYGCLDMCGNVWEWVSDVHRDDTWYGLFGEAQERGLLRGGAYGYGPDQGRTSYQAFEALTATCNDTGFRCAMDAKPVSSR